MPTNLEREGTHDAAEDEHDQHFDKREADPRQKKDVVLVIVVTIPELVVAAGGLHHPHRQEVPVETHHSQGLQEPRPRQPPLVL